MSHAESVRKVYTLMGDLGVSLYDLELMGHVDDESDLNRTPEETFDALIDDDEFDIVGDSHAIENYHAATAEYVGSALSRLGLRGRVAECKHCGRRIVDDEDDGWIDPEAGTDMDGDGIWRETCDANDTFEARHEPKDESNG